MPCNWKEPTLQPWMVFFFWRFYPINAEQLFKHFVKKKKNSSFSSRNKAVSLNRHGVAFAFSVFKHFLHSHLLIFLDSKSYKQQQDCWPVWRIIHPIFQLIFPKDFKGLNQVVRSLDALCHSHNQPSAIEKNKTKNQTPHLQKSMALSILSHHRDDLDDVQRGGPQEDKLLSKI